jgi:hypothetical protein
MSDHFISLIRTYAAIWIPTAAVWLAGFGVDLPVEQSTVVVTSLAISAYYAIVRLAEARCAAGFDPAADVPLRWFRHVCVPSRPAQRPGSPGPVIATTPPRG